MTIENPYAVMSDIHLHNWTQFSKVNEDGVNSRLQDILDAMEECIVDLRRVGGCDVVITGDLFHTRGVVKPSVFNPTFSFFEKWSKAGINFHIIPGNHDLEGKSSDTIGNSMASLSAIRGVTVYNEVTLVNERYLFIPWMEDANDVLKTIQEYTDRYVNLEVFCHVGLDDVVPAKIGNTISPSKLLELDFKYVFCGHFHNHVRFNNRVFSVGALTHQTWRDIGSLAGFILVDNAATRPLHKETKAPQFIQYETAKWIDTASKGNYIRATGFEISKEKAVEIRDYLMERGAKAFLDQTSRPSLRKKDISVSIEAEKTIDEALQSYCKSQYGDNWKRVYDACLKLKKLQVH